MLRCGEEAWQSTDVKASNSFAGELLPLKYRDVKTLLSSFFFSFFFFIVVICSQIIQGRISSCVSFLY